jgi:hypothetical protein
MVERVEPTNLRIDPYYIQVRMKGKSSYFWIGHYPMKDDRGVKKG